MATRAAAVALLMATLGGAARIAGAQTATSQTRATRFAGAIDVMYGRTVTRVVVEDVPALRQVVDAATLKSGMERRLRQNGITIPDDTTQLATIYPYLYLTVNLGASGDGSFVYNVSMEYKTLLEASLTNTPDIGLVMASVWERGTLGTVSRQNVVPTIRQVVDDQLTAFLDLYLDANPRK